MANNKRIFKEDEVMGPSLSSAQADEASNVVVLNTAAKKCQISIYRIRTFVTFMKEDISEFKDDNIVGRTSLQSSKNKNVIRTTQRAGVLPSTSTIRTTEILVKGGTCENNMAQANRLRSVRVFDRLLQYHNNTSNFNSNYETELNDLSLYIGSYRRKAVREADGLPIFLLNESDEGDSYDRSRLYYFVLKPLLNDLVESYKELDQSYAEADVQVQQQQSKNGTTNIADKNKQGRNNHERSSNRSSSKPKAPLGLLSLADYTDIACLLEFLVSISILPYLDTNIILPISKRIKLLPKSLRGRLNNSSLLWGTFFYDEVENRSKGTASTTGTSIHSKNKKRTMVPLAHVIRSIKELHESSLLLAKVCTMDRFIPMMLPRHLADIYAGLAQVHHMDELVVRMQMKRQGPNQESSSKSPNEVSKGALDVESMKVWQLELYYKLRLTSLLQPESVNSTTLSESIREVNQIDATMIIKAYQTVLLNGSLTPLWLRRQVSKELSILAQSSHLDAIVAVFVKAADHLPGADMTAAASRLAKALMVGAPNLSATEDNTTTLLKSNDEIVKANFKPIFQQLFQLTSNFVNSVGTSTRTQTLSTSATPITSLAGPTTAACLISLLIPKQKQLIENFWFQPLVDIIFHPIISQCNKHSSTCVVVQDFDVSHFIHCCHVWLCMTCPPTKDVCEMIMTSRLSNNKNKYLYYPSMFQLILWIVVGAPLSPDSETGRRTLARILETCTVEKEGNNNTGSFSDTIETILTAIAQSVTDVHPNSIPLSFRPSSSGGCEVRFSKANNNSYSSSELQLNSDTDSTDTSIKEIEQRAKMIVQVLQEMIFSKNGSTSATGADIDGIQRNNMLVGMMFETVLRKYINSLSSMDPDSQPKQNHDIAAMILLPLLLENFDAISLLGSSSPIPVFRMIRSVLESGIPIKCCTKKEDSAFNNTVQRTNTTVSSYRPMSNTISTDMEANSSRIETLLSTCSLCLSLLVSILELGNQHRPKEEEEYIKSFQPILTKYMEVAVGMDHSKELRGTWSELAEMSAHACSLIMSRGLSSTDETECTSRSTDIIEDEKWDEDDEHENNKMIFIRQIRLAETDLESNMPPIRARGVSQLTRMARAITEKHDNDIRMKISIKNAATNERQRRGPLITELQSDGKYVDSSHHVSKEKLDSDTWIAEEILLASLKGLLDDESYVYLAAIQTISALCDTDPAYFLPQIIEASISGFVQCRDHERRKIPLEISQRVKLTEAILFAIRRRGHGLGNYLSTLIPLLLYGSYKKNHSSSRSLEELRSFQEQTYNFLQTGKLMSGENSTESEMDSVSFLEEKLKRINVGCPVSQTEELSALRSGAILCLAEIVTLVSPQSVSHYIHHIMKLGINILQLERERPMRRAASLLVREVYTAVLNEVYDVLPNMINNKSDNILPLTVALLQSNESHLNDTLLSITEQTITRVDDGGYLYDAAVFARCQEALENRTALIESGGFDLANTLLRSKQQLEKELARAPKIIQDLSNGTS